MSTLTGTELEHSLSVLSRRAVALRTPDNILAYTTAIDLLEAELAKLPHPLPTKIGSIIEENTGTRFIRIGPNEWVNTPAPRGTDIRGSVSVWNDQTFIEANVWKEIK